MESPGIHPFHRTPSDIVLKEKIFLKIRLIDPAYKDPFISHSQKVIKNIWFARLTLTTLAALTPSGIDVKITDENVEPIDFEEEVDLVDSCRGCRCGADIGGKLDRGDDRVGVARRNGAVKGRGDGYGLGALSLALISLAFPWLSPEVICR